MNSHVTSAIGGSCFCVKWKFTERQNVESLLTEMEPAIIFNIVDKAIPFNGNLKWYMAIKIRFNKLIQFEKGFDIQTQDAVFHSSSRTVIDASNNSDLLHQQYAENISKILNSLANFNNKGSGWVIDTIMGLELNICRYRPIHGANSSYIELPQKVAASRAVINVLNANDSRCFLWSVLCHFYNPTNRMYRISALRKLEGRLNVRGLTFPMSVKQIDLFETNNPSIGINVYGYEAEKHLFYPHRITEHQQREHIIHLLLINGDQPDKFHYTYINTKANYNGLSRLFSGCTKSESHTAYCPRCLHRFVNNTTLGVSAKLNLEKHLVLCKEKRVQRIEMPDPNSVTSSKMYFRNFSSTLRVPFVVYADLESYIVPLASTGEEEEEVTTPSSDNTAIHIPCGYSYVVVDENGCIFRGPVTYRSSSVEEKIMPLLLGELLALAEELKPTLKSCVPINMTQDAKRIFYNSVNCFLCNRELLTDRVRHHCHMSGEFLGACHNACNLNAQKASFIPVFFHNLRGYDAHHIIQALSEMDTSKTKINVIANSSEKFMSFSLGKLRFVDSLQFLGASLDTLVTNLKDGGGALIDTFKRTCSHFLPLYAANSSDSINELLDLLLKKGVYPYEYITDAQKFEEKCLPPIESFYSSLTEESITPHQYAHAQAVWHRLGIDSLGSFHNSYLTLDTMLLSDVMENFREMCMKVYMLDPTHFFSTPHLSWNAMLKTTGACLDLLTDPDMHLFIESGVRGGVAMITHRYATANNPLVPETYDPSKPNSWLIYNDYCNLYGASQCNSLPESNFRWLTAAEIAQEPWVTAPIDGDLGYIVEVDLIYPKSLHDAHADFPLAPVTQVPPSSERSPFLSDIKINTNPKLLNTLHDKKNYITHFQNLQLYMRLGLIVSAVHRVVVFKQSQWLKPYIDLNSKFRKHAKNSFEKDLFKLMNNACYGKSLESVRKRVDFEIVTAAARLDKLMAKPRVKRWFIYNEGVVGVSLKKTKITLNRPITVGFSILEISKCYMYRYHYDYIRTKYGSMAKLLFTDTDSLVYSIQTPDVYSDMKENSHLFDLSNFPSDHPCFDETNKKVVGKMKDEFGGCAPREFVGLMAKLYSIILSDNEEKKVAKGVQRIAISRHLSHKKYLCCLQDHICSFVSAHKIRSERHRIFTTRQVKKALSPWDNKRFVLSDGVTTLPYGHFRIPEEMSDIDKEDDCPILNAKCFVDKDSQTLIRKTYNQTQPLCNYGRLPVKRKLPPPRVDYVTKHVNMLERETSVPSFFITQRDLDEAGPSGI